MLGGEELDWGEPRCMLFRVSAAVAMRSKSSLNSWDTITLSDDGRKPHTSRSQIHDLNHIRRLQAVLVISWSVRIG